MQGIATFFIIDEIQFFFNFFFKCFRTKNITHILKLLFYIRVVQVFYLQNSKATGTPLLFITPS